MAVPRFDSNTASINRLYTVVDRVHRFRQRSAETFPTGLPDGEIMLEKIRGELANTDQLLARGFSNIISPSGWPVENVPVDLWYKIMKN